MKSVGKIGLFASPVIFLFICTTVLLLLGSTLPALLYVDEIAISDLDEGVSLDRASHSAKESLTLAGGKGDSVDLLAGAVTSRPDGEGDSASSPAEGYGQELETDAVGNDNIVRGSGSSDGIPFSVVLVLIALIGLVSVGRRGVKGA